MSFSLGYFPFPEKPLFCRACVPSPTKGGGDGRSLAAMGRGGRTRGEREKEPKTAATTTEEPKKSRFFAFFFPAPEWRRASFFFFPFSLFLFVRGLRFRVEVQPPRVKVKGGGKGKSAYLLGLAPKAMSESCGIFFFRRRHFSFAAKEEERKIPSPPSFHLPPSLPQLLIRVPRWFVALEAATDTRGQWSIPIPLYTAYGPSLVHYFPTK